MAANQTHAEAIAEIKAMIEDVSRRIGEETIGEKGSTGTGLTGRIIRAEAKVDGLLALRARGVGLLIGVFLALAVIVMGVKQTIATVLGGLHG